MGKEDFQRRKDNRSAQNGVCEGYRHLCGVMEAEWKGFVEIAQIAKAQKQGL